MYMNCSLHANARQQIRRMKRDEHDALNIRNVLVIIDCVCVYLIKIYVFFVYEEINIKKTFQRLISACTVHISQCYISYILQHTYTICTPNTTLAASRSASIQWGLIKSLSCVYAAIVNTSKCANQQTIWDNSLKVVPLWVYFFFFSKLNISFNSVESEFDEIGSINEEFGSKRQWDWSSDRIKKLT